MSKLVKLANYVSTPIKVSDLIGLCGIGRRCAGEPMDGRQAEDLFRSKKKIYEKL
jgi:hypothetical protein